MNNSKNIFSFRHGIVISQIMPVRTHNLLQALAASVLLGLAWYWHLGILIFFGFVPLLLLEEKFRMSSDSKKRFRFSLLVYVSFLTWNILVTWWIVNASLGGALMAFFCNALLMTVVFVIYSRLRRRFTAPSGAWILIPLWIAFEYIHTLWDITWTWLSLGNVFAFHPQWIQWYEYTGVTGGSIWILAVNIFCYQLITKNEVRSLRSSAILRLAALILLPMLLSRLLLLFPETEKSVTANVVLVQPNSDPYNEKFSTSYESQFIKMLKQVRGKVNAETDLLVLPETFVTGFVNDLNENELNSLPEVQAFRDSLIHYFPKLRIITGANTFRYYTASERVSATARLDKRMGLYYDFYNSALYISATESFVYHKSKLVPGVEKMPFPWLMKPLESFAIDLGGTVGSLGTQEVRSVFQDPEKSINIAPVICYESVYGDFMTGYMRQGAGLICIITNDGWWGDTPGYRQHLAYAALRAIEARRPIIRCANTGVSCFISSQGIISQATPYWEPAVISGQVSIHEQQTFFVKFGDLLAYSAVVISSVLIGVGLFLHFRQKKQRTTA